MLAARSVRDTVTRALARSAAQSNRHHSRSDRRRSLRPGSTMPASSGKSGSGTRLMAQEPEATRSSLCGGSACSAVCSSSCSAMTRSRVSTGGPARAAAAPPAGSPRLVSSEWGADPMSARCALHSSARPSTEAAWRCTSSSSWGTTSPSYWPRSPMPSSRPSTCRATSGSRSAGGPAQRSCGAGRGASLTMRSPGASRAVPWATRAPPPCLVRFASGPPSPLAPDPLWPAPL
mmetsp:Transcript_4415/g.14721  ORF Transcript_4415/g.14721 Transcript_4415/m.14721 type:complete len:233 (+) Transcript_4415:609-1307(+)